MSEPHGSVEHGAKEVSIARDTDYSCKVYNKIRTKSRGFVNYFPLPLEHSFDTHFACINTTFSLDCVASYSKIYPNRHAYLTIALRFPYFLFI